MSSVIILLVKAWSVYVWQNCVRLLFEIFSGVTPSNTVVVIKFFVSLGRRSIAHGVERLK